MEFKEVLETRRSIRSFDGSRKVTKEQLAELLLAAGKAPSWKNSQTARTYCVVSHGLLEKVKSECLPQFNQRSSAGASALLVTAFVPNRSGYDTQTGTPVNEGGNGWGYYDLGMHDQNLLLAARDLGLGTLVMGIRDAGKLRELLAIPAEQEIVSVIAVGYPAAEPQMPPRKALEEVARFF